MHRTVLSTIAALSLSWGALSQTDFDARLERAKGNLADTAQSITQNLK